MKSSLQNRTATKLCLLTYPLKGLGKALTSLQMRLRHSCKVSVSSANSCKCLAFTRSEPCPDGVIAQHPYRWPTPRIPTTSPPLPRPDSHGSLTSWGLDNFSFVAHASEVELQELPGVLLIHFKVEISPLVDHLTLRIGNWKATRKAGSNETGKPG